MNDPNCKYTECYVAFIDILGFAALVKQSENDPKLVRTLVRILNEAANPPRSEHTHREVRYENGGITAGEECVYRVQVSAFSDSVDLFIPVESQAFPWLLNSVRYIHDRILELGCTIRGAITIGDMYWDTSWSSVEASKPAPKADITGDNTSVAYERGAIQDTPIVLGPAHIEAYRLESETAVYPRTIFSSKLMEHLDRRAKEKPERETEKIHSSVRAIPLCSMSPKNNDRTILDFIRSDVDGVPYLDFFHSDIVRSDTERIVREQLPHNRWRLRWDRDKVSYEDFMRNTKSTIESFLQMPSLPKIRAKQLWLANYFNESISQYKIEPVRVQW
jgi:hypothetical protein